MKYSNNKEQIEEVKKERMKEEKDQKRNNGEAESFQ